MPNVRVQEYDPNEETTCIDEAILLTSNATLKWVLLPLMSLLSLFSWPIFVYWYVTLQRDWLYRRAQSI